MSESLCIDSPMRGLAMPKAYSGDLRERVIEEVAMGASRREAADRFGISASSSVKWLQRWHEDRSAAPKPRGGSVSPLDEFAAEILALIAEQPDLTLVETVAKLRRRRIRMGCGEAGSERERESAAVSQVVLPQGLGSLMRRAPRHF